MGARIKHVPLVVGYHWHPTFSMDQIPKLIDQVLTLGFILSGLSILHRKNGYGDLRFYETHG